MNTSNASKYELPTRRIRLRNINWEALAVWAVSITIFGIECGWLYGKLHG